MIILKETEVCSELKNYIRPIHLKKNPPPPTKLSFLQIYHVTRNTFYNIGTDNSEIKEAFEIYLLFGPIS